MMKKVTILLLISMTVMGCKDNQKKDTKMPSEDVNESTMTKANDTVDRLELGCYEYKTDGNNVKLEVTKIEGDAVTANLLYAYAEKDKNEGTFHGFINGDKLMGQYKFMSEGKESVRDVAFKVEKEQLVEGFGDLDEGGTKFKDTTNLSYSITTPWKKTACE
ncbi:MAG: hypothetical protein ACSHXF_08795 [Aquaticitalea sp.]